MKTGTVQLQEAVAYVRTILHRALSEDIGPGDATSLALGAQGKRLAGRVVLRSGGIVCGGFVIEETLAACSRFLGVDTAPVVEVVAHDGLVLQPGEVVARIDGDATVILASERVFLNFLGMMTGIASLTRKYVDAVAGTKCTILDTRKTMPLLRGLQKYAVRTGGGTNHRYGLYDQILVKDNHLVLSGMNAGEASRRAKAYRDNHLLGTPVEVEAGSTIQMVDAIRNGADIVLLDNMKPSEVREAVKTRDGMGATALLEVSGGVTLENVREYALTGVDRISVGRLTHSAPFADVAFDAEAV